MVVGQIKPSNTGINKIQFLKGIFSAFACALSTTYKDSCPSTLKFCLRTTYDNVAGAVLL